MAVFTVTDHVIDTQHIRQYPHATATPDARLQLAVRKYTPVDNPNPQPGDVTIIGFQGTGFPKELYEPLWEDLLARSKQDGFRIRAIWMADTVTQGASGVLNENQLGNDPSWADHSRDVLLMVNHFRDEMPRPIMGFGHSLGAGQLILLSIMHPRLFTSLLLTEPWLHEKYGVSYGIDLICGASKRKDLWPSRSAAEQKARRSFRAWDPRVLNLWFQHGYRNLPTAIYPSSAKSQDGETPVTLTTTKHQEAFLYSRPNYKRHTQLGLPDAENEKEDGMDDSTPLHDPLMIPDAIGGLYRGQRFYRPEESVTWRLLPFLRPSVLMLGGAKSPLVLSGKLEEAISLMGTGWSGSGGVAYGRVESFTIAKAGHTLPLEKVAEVASFLGPWVAREQEWWRQDEKRLAEGWEGLSVRERSTISKERQAFLDEELSITRPPRQRQASKL